MIASPGSTSPEAFSISPTAAIPSARATMATCEVAPSFLQDQAPQALAVVVQQGRGSHRARDQDRVLRKLLFFRGVFDPHQLAHQAIGKIVKVVQPFADVRVGLAHHACACIRLNPFDARFGGEAGHHRLAHAVEPAAVVREHAIGFENFAVFAAIGDFSAFEHRVHVGAKRLDRVIEPLKFLLHVVGDEILHHHARLVQHRVSERDAFRQRCSGDVKARVNGGFGTGLCERG
jgi:hypothetical protein